MECVEANLDLEEYTYSDYAFSEDHTKTGMLQTSHRQYEVVVRSKKPNILKGLFFVLLGFQSLTACLALTVVGVTCLPLFPTKSFYIPTAFLGSSFVILCFSREVFSLARFHFGL